MLALIWGLSEGDDEIRQIFHLLKFKGLWKRRGILPLPRTLKSKINIVERIDQRPEELAKDLDLC